MEREDEDFGSLHEGVMDVGLQTANRLDLNVEQVFCSPKFVSINATQPNISSIGANSIDSVLKLGSEFESDEHAYKSYKNYARLVGFNVRKDWVNRSKVHGQVVSRKFTCSREGYRQNDKRDANVKKRRKETRTGCLAHVIITRQPDSKYRVTQFEEQHNHDNINPSIAQMLPPQRESSVPQAADLVEDFGPLSKLAFDLMSRRPRIRESADSFSFDFDNHLQSERTRDTKEGEVGRLLHYFQRQHFENPSFFYAIQVDTDDKVSNIFWADDNMVSDYEHFGDVVCLDSVCRTDTKCLPFVQFIGVNHHKQVVIFSAALLYDGTVQSFEWLFQTFLETMSGKKPKVIHTDQDPALVEAINSVLPETDHRICTWQMCHSSLKHLHHVVEDTEAFANDFTSCIYDHKDEDDFVRAWGDMLDNYGLRKNDWLKWMFREREKWAVVYDRNTFFVDMKGSHLVESLFNDLRKYLNSDPDVLHFFKHFERVVDEQRCKEIEASVEMNRCIPRLMGNVILLRHASNVYTPRAFQVFQRGYEKSLDIVVNQCSENDSLFEYKTNIFGKSTEHTVTFNSSDDIVICSCKKFESVGFLCSHALKVLDHRNIKVLPSKYILKRWTKDARLGSARVSDAISDNPKLIVGSRYKILCHRILMLPARASESEEAFQFAVRQLDQVMEGVEKILTLSPEDAQAFTSSRTAANVSDTEHAKIFLDEFGIDNQDDNRVKGAEEKDGAVLDRGPLTNVNGEYNASIQNTGSCISSLLLYASPQAATENAIIQASPGLHLLQLYELIKGLYNFETNQVVQCMHEQDNLVINQQTDPNMFFSNEHDSPGHSQLLEEPLINGVYQEPVSSTPEVRQAMDLDVQTPSSFLVFDGR
ncbi:hypothetical protein ACFX14_001945 [Malus domestica]